MAANVTPYKKQRKAVAFLKRLEGMSERSLRQERSYRQLKAPDGQQWCAYHKKYHARGHFNSQRHWSCRRSPKMRHSYDAKVPLMCVACNKPHAKHPRCTACNILTHPADTRCEVSRCPIGDTYANENY